LQKLEEEIQRILYLFRNKKEKDRVSRESNLPHKSRKILRNKCQQINPTQLIELADPLLYTLMMFWCKTRLTFSYV